MLQNESELQQWVVMKTRKHTDWFIFSVPNEGRRGKRQAQKMIAQGLSTGVSDLVVMMTGKTEYWEVKEPKGKQSAEQIEFQYECAYRGHKYRLIRHPRDLERIFKEHGIHSEN
jgi:hypothetical protein